jgi:hypothetical protein
MVNPVAAGLKEEEERPRESFLAYRRIQII